MLAQAAAHAGRLNPFEFRAGLEQTLTSSFIFQLQGLNPFEFRAGLERPAWITKGRRCVLIPLNSGLAWSSKVEKTLA